MSRFPSEVKFVDFASKTQRNGYIITAVSLADTNPGIPVLVLSECNIRAIFRQCKTTVQVIGQGGPVDLTILFDKIEFVHLVGNLAKGPAPLRPDHNYT